MPATKVQLKTMSYVILYVKDTAKSSKFYSDTLGMKVKLEHPGWVELETGAVTLALHGVEDVPSKPTTGHPEVCFTVDNVYEVHEELKKAGVKFITEPRQVCEEGENVGVSAAFYDHDQNILSIYSHLHKSKVRH